MKIKHITKKCCSPLVLLPLILVILLIFSGCDPGFNIIIENRTDEVLVIYLAEGKSNTPNRQGVVEPGEDFKTRGLWLTFNHYTIVAENEQGDVVFYHEFDYFELRDDYEFVVVITPPEED